MEERTTVEETVYERDGQSTETITHTVTVEEPEREPIVIVEEPEELPEPETNELAAALALLSTSINELREMVATQAEEIGRLRDEVATSVNTIPDETPNAEESGKTEVSPPPPAPEQVPQRKHIYHSFPKWI